jgi:hypothetical protein
VREGRLRLRDFDGIRAEAHPKEGGAALPP